MSIMDSSASYSKSWRYSPEAIEAGTGSLQIEGYLIKVEQMQQREYNKGQKGAPLFWHNIEGKWKCLPVASDRPALDFTWTLVDDNGESWEIGGISPKSRSGLGAAIASCVVEQLGGSWDATWGRRFRFQTKAGDWGATSQGKAGPRPFRVTVIGEDTRPFQGEIPFTAGQVKQPPKPSQTVVDDDWGAAPAPARVEEELTLYDHDIPF